METMSELLIDWKKTGKKRQGRQKKTEQRMEAMDQISEFKKTYTSAGTKLVTMTNV